MSKITYKEQRKHKCLADYCEEEEENEKEKDDEEK